MGPYVGSVLRACVGDGKIIRVVVGVLRFFTDMVKNKLVVCNTVYENINLMKAELNHHHYI